MGEAGGFVIDGGVGEEDGGEGGPVGDFAPVVGGEEGDAGEGDEPGGEEVHDEDRVFAEEVDIEAAEEGGIEDTQEGRGEDDEAGEAEFGAVEQEEAEQGDQ